MQYCKCLYPAQLSFVVESLSHVQPLATPRAAACQASLFLTTSQSLLKHMSFESVMPSKHLILCLLLVLLPSIFPSIKVFSSESVLGIWQPKDWSFSSSISPSSEYLGCISFQIDWFDLLAVQGTLKSLLQPCNSKASVFWHSAFLMVQLSHPYMTGKNHSFDSMTSVCKVMSLLFNKLSFGAFPDGASGKELARQCTRHKRFGFNPWVGKIHWRRKWQPIPVFLPGESHGQRSLAGYRVHEVTKSWT